MAERDDAAQSEQDEAAQEETVPTYPEHIEPLVAAIADEFPELHVHMRQDDWPEVNVPPQRATQFFSFIKTDARLAFDYLSDLTAVDYEDEGFQVVYHFIALGLQAENAQRKLAVKIDVPRDAPVVDSVVSLWPTANFHEREVWDMMGVVFDGHPDLRRILMREDWVGHPLRKDYVDRRPPRPRVVAKSPGRR